MLSDLSISFNEYSPWLIFACLALGVSYCAVLYYKNSSLKETPLFLVKTLNALRFFTISVIAFLFLNPLISSLFKQVEKPIIIIAVDDSESILMNQPKNFQDDSLVKFKTDIKKLSNDLSKNFIVKMYSFGKQAKTNDNFQFAQKQTDISQLFSEINSTYDNRNLGAIVIATDGLYNKGLNPLYGSRKTKTPIYTIALGDTSIRKDLKILKLRHNELAFSGNQFPVEIKIKADQCRNENVNFKIIKDGKTEFQNKFKITENNFLKEFTIQLEAKDKGIQHYTLQLSELNNETTIKNNQQDFYIDVLDSKQKILILANSSHPDISAIKNSIESHENYEVDILTIGSLNKSYNQNHFNPEKYNLIVLHQIPSVNNNYQPFYNKVITSGTPLLYIIGQQSNIYELNKAQTGIQITQSKNGYNESQGFLNEKFNLFTISEELKSTINNFTPLISPFGNYSSNYAESTLLFQKIGNIKSNYPLLLFNASNEKKSAILVGEGVWKWRLKEFAQNGNHNRTNELITKTVQYLATKDNKEQFMLINKPKNFFENEPVFFEAEVYNASYELINTADITILIKNKNGKEFTYTFNKKGNSYFMDAGIFPVGEFNYKARTSVDNKIHEINGEFSVKALQVETQITIADHQLLYAIAKNHDGELVYPDQLNILSGKITSREDMKSISYTTKKLLALIDLSWILVLLIASLSAEWFIRKREGLV